MGKVIESRPSVNVRASIGDNSRADDPGVAIDFVLTGPVFLRQDLVDRDKLNEFCAAIRAQGDERVRHRTIDNALTRLRADPGIGNFGYRVLAQVAAMSHGRHRYHGMPMEALALFTRQSDGSHMHRALGEIAKAVVIILIPRRAGGRPMKFIALKCTAEDRTGAAVAGLYDQARDRYNGVQKAKRDGCSWSDLVEEPTRQIGEMTQPDGETSASTVETNAPDRRDEHQASRQFGVHQSPKLATRVQQEDCTKDSNSKGSTSSSFGSDHHAREEGKGATGAQEDLTPSATYKPSESEYEECRQLHDSFGRPGGAILAAPACRDDTDAFLDRKCQTHLGGYRPSVARRALAATFDWARAVTADNGEAGNTGNGSNRLRRLNNAFDKLLPGKAAEFALAEASIQAQAMTEQAVQERNAVKRLNGVESGGAARRSSPVKSKSAIFDEFKA
jgi:hypothetical protein